MGVHRVALQKALGCWRVTEGISTESSGSVAGYRCYVLVSPGLAPAG
jgi:hypothetical protein